MAVYTKTTPGRLAAFSKQTDLPAALKLLLQSIDGKTPFYQLVNRLGPEACSAELLQQLETAGLVRAVIPESGEHSTGDSGYPHMPTIPASLSPQNATRFANNAVAPRFPGTADAPGFASNADAPRGPVRVATSSNRNGLVEEAKDAMGEFILTYLPQYAHAVLKEIEEIDTVEKLMCTLDGYASVVSQAGHVGMRHVQNLRIAVGQQAA